MVGKYKILVFGGDSDSEYSEYDDELIQPCKRFNMRPGDAISEKALRRHIKLGIPRRTGHYQLQTRNSSRARPSSHFYNGHHWEVGPASIWGDSSRGRSSGQVRFDDEPPTNPLVLEHTTRNLTVCAINTAVDMEQFRRMRQEAREIEYAARLYAPLNQEFARAIAFNMDEDKKQERSFHKLVEGEKDCMLQELLHKKNQETVDDQMEAERNRRVSLMHDFTDTDKCTDNPNLLQTLKGLSQAAKNIQVLQQELMSACNDLEEVSHEEDHAVEDLFLELKDDFVASFKRATLLMKFHMAEENEKRRRMAEAREYFTNRKNLDKFQKETMKRKDHLQEEMTRMFAGIIQNEAQKESITEENTQVHKTEAQEELLHRLASRQADNMCSVERIRRIKELYEEARGRPDAFKEHIKDVMMEVQEQMLMQKFHGKKIMFRMPQDNFSQKHYEGETEQDRKLRNARLKSRRQSCVVTGF